MRRFVFGAALLAGGVLLVSCQQEQGGETESGAQTEQTSAPQTNTAGAAFTEFAALCPGGANCPDDLTVGLLFSPAAVKALRLDAPPAETDAAPATDTQAGTGTEPETLLKKPTTCPQAGPLACGLFRSGLVWRTAKGQINCRPDKECMEGVPIGVYGWLCTPDPNDEEKCEGMPRGEVTAARTEQR